MLLLPWSQPQFAQADEVRLKFCVEETEFPPFNYFLRNQDGSLSRTSAGYDIDVLNLSFTANGMTVDIFAQPWSRCLRDVREGRIDGAMSASLNDERRRDYIPSRGYYTLTPSYFYLQDMVSLQHEITNAGELATEGTICGIRGFNYVNFGWLNNSSLHEINSLNLLPEMLRRGRCKFFLAREETLTGTLALYPDIDFKGQLVGQAFPFANRESFHMLVSKKSPHAELILKQFDQSVAVFEENGKLEELLNKHLERVRHEGLKGR
jgi:polar amino acid transport system substrate-binding protein